MADENLPVDEQAVGTSEPDSEDVATPENSVSENPDGVDAGSAQPEESPVESEPNAEIGGEQEAPFPGDAIPGGEVSDQDDVADVSGQQADPSELDSGKEESMDDAVEKQMLAELEKMKDNDDISFGGGSAAPGNDVAEVSQADFTQLSGGGGQSSPQNLDLLLDVDLPISIELGRTSMNIQEILALGPGSVVELDKLAGEPVDLLVNNKIVAKGEVVVIDENFGIRVTNLISPEERLKSLGE